MNQGRFPTIVIVCYERFRSAAVAAALAVSLPGATIDTADAAEQGMDLVSRSKPDLAILDTCMPDLDGLDYIPQIVKTRSSSAVAVMTSRCDERTLEVIRHQQIRTWIDLANETPADLGPIFQSAINGISYRTPTIRAALAKPRSPVCKFLSFKEEATLAVMGEGIGDSAAAERLKIAIKTAKRHRDDLMWKLEVHDRGQLTSRALALGYTRLLPSGRYLHPGFDLYLRTL